MTDQLNQPTNQQPQAPDYGEPWKILISKIKYKPGRMVCDKNIIELAKMKSDKIYADRIIACVNACAGIPSKDLTPSRVKKWMAMAKLVEAGDPADGK